MSHGFRPGRSCHDAIETIFKALSRKTTFILDADISGCSDNINHNKLLEKLNTTSTLTKVIRGWLKAGIMENGIFKPTAVVQSKEEQSLLYSLVLLYMV
ncbi:reverse transcriptase domain-containing protein [Candidatus Mesenet endosymbiont of Agriotes lineatus]|uniref:reverse transcriptase domain-containing protein n=1 Tax=Candidatus Mesenet endosymbiont of Agriotes lineatus TaxID=3077948 RepID=UPI0030D07710